MQELSWNDDIVPKCIVKIEQLAVEVQMPFVEQDAHLLRIDECPAIQSSRPISQPSNGRVA